MKQVHVAVGVIINGDDIFLTRRHQEAHQGGKWEFPGGKVEKEESVAQALYRELKEEINIEVLSAQPLITIEHDYGDKQVKLDVFIVDNYLNEPQAQEGQQQAWFNISELAGLDFPKANVEIVEKLLAIYR
ncbi:MAG: 8-oxo-dGTP diphosphatase MutT [Thalassotalea sp.]